MKNRYSFLILFSITILGFFLRIYGLNWDQNFHLHPDERFLTMVGNAMKLPENFSIYLNTKTSPMNPMNIGFPFYVYGTFPVVINKLLAIFLNHDNYNLFTLQGRLLSVIFDTFTIVFIYLATELITKKYHWDKKIPYLAGFLYAIAVLPIQLSHFFTVDMFLNFFSISSFYFTYKYYCFRKNLDFTLSAILFALAFACKISAIFILPLNIIFLLFALLPDHSHISIKKIFHLKIKKVFVILILYGFFIYIISRIANPYLFESSNIFNFSINHKYTQNWAILNNEYSPGTTFPPAIQFLHSMPIIFSLKNLIFFGLGIPEFLLLLCGTYFCFRKIKNLELYVIFFWTLGIFIYQSTAYIKFMRYFIVIYPFLAIFSAIGFSYLFKKINIIYWFIIIVILLIWPFSFLSIYVNKHSRITASEWIYKNLPNKSVILNELWDDPLPLYVNANYGKQFDVEMMPVFDIDSTEKWTKMIDLLNKGNYLILSSNRAWASIPTVPERYPLTIKYYQDLFAGRSSYKKIKEFNSYPSLSYLDIPITFPDYWADENFTVFDHPQVIIFKKI